MNNYSPMAGPSFNGNGQGWSEVKYDPMTGQPINQGPSNNGKGKLPLPLPLIIAAAVTAVAAVVAFIIVISGSFKSDSVKVMQAIANTFKEKSQMAEALEGFDILLGDAYTINMKMDVEGEAIDAQYVTKDNDKQVFAALDISGVPEMDVLVEINSSKVRAQVPDFSDYVFTYDYKAEKKGYITKEVDEEIFAAIDEACELIYSTNSQSELSKKISRGIMKEINALEFEKVDKKEYEINDKKVKCSGYTTEITEDFFMNIIDVIEETVDEEYGDMFKDLEVEDYVEEAYDEVRSELEYLEDAELTFYIYKNKLACIAIEIEKEELEIIFRDCEKGMHNIELCLEDQTVMEIKGSVKDSVEKYKIKTMYDESMSLEYDAKSGDYEIEAEDGELKIEGNLKKDSKGVTFTIEEIEDYGYTEEMEIEVSISKDAKLKKFDGEEFDIGNASEDDFEEVAEDIYSIMYEF